MKCYIVLLLWLHRVDCSLSTQRFISETLASLKGGGGNDDAAWYDEIDFESGPDDSDICDDPEGSPLDELQLHPLLQIPLSLGIVGSSKPRPVQAFCDTGAQRTILSKACAERVGILHLLDRRYAGKATGVGSCRVLGRLPAGVAQLHIHGSVTVDAPALTVIESTGTPGVELLIGLDLLRDLGAIVDLRKEELAIICDQGQEHRIPFVRPRKGGMATEQKSTTPAKQASSSMAAGETDDWSDFDDRDELDNTGEKLDMSGL